MRDFKKNFSTKRINYLLLASCNLFNGYEHSMNASKKCQGKQNYEFPNENNKVVVEFFKRISKEFIIIVFEQVIVIIMKLSFSTFKLTSTFFILFKPVLKFRARLLLPSMLLIDSGNPNSSPTLKPNEMQ